MSQHLDLAYTDFVKDEESLYRSVWRKDYCFFMSDEGNLCLSGEAFADKKRKPSVSRKHLCENPPYSKLPRLSDNDAVVLLTAEIIRKNANPITHKSGKNPQINHIIDVIPDIELPNHILPRGNLCNT